MWAFSFSQMFSTFTGYSVTQTAHRGLFATRLRSSLYEFLKDSRITWSFLHLSSAVHPSTITQFIGEERKKLSFIENTYRGFSSTLSWASLRHCYDDNTQAWDLYPYILYTFVSSNSLLFFVLPPVAVIFGALHCIWRNFQFPTVPALAHRIPCDRLHPIRTFCRRALLHPPYISWQIRLLSLRFIAKKCDGYARQLSRHSSQGQDSLHICWHVSCCWESN